MATIMDETLEAEVSKQATKALKCVAYTSKQVGDILHRKHERVLQRIGAVSQEIESLKHDIADNVAHQRERRQQLNEAEEDLERAQLLGNNAIINELLEEIQVLQEENKREEALHRALSRTVRMRIEAKRLFLRERLAVEEEMRSFDAKQKLIQTLLSECAKNSSSLTTQGSSASQSDCGASDLEDEEPELSGEGRGSLGSSSGSSVSSGSSQDKVHAADRPKSIMKSTSNPDGSPKRPTLRVRSWSSDCVPEVPIEQQQTRTRHSLSVALCVARAHGRRADAGRAAARRRGARPLRVHGEHRRDLDGRGGRGDGQADDHHDQALLPRRRRRHATRRRRWWWPLEHERGDVPTRPHIYFTTDACHTTTTVSLLNEYKSASSCG
ncbi:hypothetical protein PINS_up021323 [Pythium insidiosum]|nr:hypothetical protein PINS_up021323 [Pythium insidiosum]